MDFLLLLKPQISKCLPVKVIKFGAKRDVLLLKLIFLDHYKLDVAPLPVTVTTRIITFSVWDPHKPSFITVTGRGPHPNYTC